MKKSIPTASRLSTRECCWLWGV